jgi:DNA helicase II / ATP-dependent DNA helicase PcrA
METHLEGLNPAQLEAVQAVEGPLLIVAGPGSGKTRVIVHRIAHLVLSHHVAPWEILAVTFTNKAAREMRERIEGLLGHNADGLAMGTFHAQCARFLRRDGAIAGIDTRFAIFDDGDQVDLVRKILRDMEIDDKRFSARSILSAISASKSELITPEAYSKRAQGFWQELVSNVYRRYAQALTDNHALDFDDLIGETVRLFTEAPEVLERYQDRYQYLMVDEFQDTNVAQYRLVRMLAAKNKNVCVVGDEDQGVYSWRQADIRNLMYFERDFPEARTIMLEQNYRSTQTILDVAQAVIAPNTQRKNKKLWTENDAGRPVIVHEAFNEGDEAQFVLREVERLARSEHVRLSDVAIMYRVNAQSRALEDALVRRGMPYRLVGGTRFYERKEVKDVLAYLRLTQNPADSVSLARIINVPARGIGERTITEVQHWGERAGLTFIEAIDAVADGKDEAEGHSILQGRARNAIRSFADLIRALGRARTDLNTLDLLDFVLDASGYARHLRDGTDEGEERWQNIMELRTKAADFAELAPPLGLAALLEEVALVQDVDSFDPNSDGVTLITLHAAKGLEFPFVFLVGLEEGLCPHSRSLDDPLQMEEERRLVYVGITRAMRGLYMVHAYRRTLYGMSMNNEPSRFLADVPANLREGGRSAPAHPVGSTGFAPRDYPARASAAERTEIPPVFFGKSMNGSSIPAAPIPKFMVPHIAAGPRPETIGGPPMPAPPQPGSDQQYFPGDRVHHPAFGTGVVVSSVVNRGDEEVTIAFEGKGIKKLSASYAPLQRT